MSEKLKFGIIGYGQIGRRHRQEIEGNPDAELVGICDYDFEKIKQIKDCNLYRDSSVISKIDDIDVISICTPNYLHSVMTIYALQSGKHVICEKPMSLLYEQCLLMEEVAINNNKMLFVVKQNRFNPPIAALRQAIQEGRLGRIFQIAVNCYWNRNDEYYRQSDWRGIKLMDGGALYTQFSHFIDILIMLTGDLDWHCIYSIHKNCNHREIEIDDCGAAIVEFKNGVIGSVNYTTNSFGKNMEGSVTVFGEKATVKVGGQYLNVVEYQQGIDLGIHGMSGNPANDYGFYQGSMSNHDKVYEDVIGCLLHGKKSQMDLEDAIATVRLIEGIYRE